MKSRPSLKPGGPESKNGKLLKLAATAFAVFVTVDQNLRHQQNLTLTTLAIVVLCAKSNRYQDLLPLVPELNRVLGKIRPMDVVEIGDT